MLTAREILERLYTDRDRTPRGISRFGGVAPCPQTCAHGNREDRNPSFSVSQKGSKILINCKAGLCTQPEAIDGLRALGLWHEKATEVQEVTTQDPSPFEAVPDNKPDQEWEYTDGGKVYAIHARWNFPDGTKKIRWRLPSGTYSEGLGDLRLESLPLYGADLLADPTRESEPVYFVEGEKCADILRKNNLIGVSAGSGSSGRKFGSMLQPLAGRVCYILPDNDSSGRKYALAVRNELRSICKEVTIVTLEGLPHKGDIVDWIDAGHTTGELLDQIKVPTAKHLGHDRIEVVIPVELSELKSNAVLLFENMRTSAGKLEADVTLTPPKSPVFTENFTTHRRVNLKSSSGVSAFRRDCEEAYSKDLDWKEIITQAVSLASREMFASESSSAVDLAKYRDKQAPLWLIDQLLPANMFSIMFGNGDNLKTLTVHSMMLHLATGIPWLGYNIDRPHKVLAIDYENFEESWGNYNNRLAMGLPDGAALPENRLFYMNSYGIPFADQLSKISKQVEYESIDVICIDALGAACGGNPSDVEAVLDFFRAIQRVMGEQHVAVIGLAHTTKGSTTQDGKAESKFPLGSIMWHNSARSTFLISKERDEDRPDSFFVNMENKKFNRGAPPDPVRANFKFNDPDGAIYVTRG